MSSLPEALMKNAVEADPRNAARLFPALPIVGVAFAIAATTTMDATGLSAFSALALLPLMLLFWHLDGLSRSEIGFRCGAPPHYALALLYPLVVIGIIALLAAFAGAIDLSKTNWQKALLNLLIVTISTALVAIVTEEGFFRGWLWGSLRRKSISDPYVLICTSVAFATWHVSAVTLDTEFRPAPRTGRQKTKRTRSERIKSLAGLFAFDVGRWALSVGRFLRHDFSDPFCGSHRHHRFES